MRKLARWLAPAPLLISIPMLIFANSGQAEDTDVNRLLASQCAQCHGTNGYSQNDIEGIAGEDAKDMFEDLTDMKGEDQPENIMDHQALGYTDDQIRRIASYYATLPEDQPGGGGESEFEAEHEPEETE